ncbi:MAG: S24/S26 family peptidase [Opitutae bacterium]|nr:S24/S26 family peptidase [Opitutae bacterium]
MKKSAFCPPWLAGALALALAGSGCETTAPTAAQPVPQATPSANVPKLQVWKDTEMLAAREQGRGALIGGGASMNPIYGDNTMLVVTPIGYDDLRVGMYVVYLNRYNRRVAHVLIAKEAKGWRAQGLNNPEQDNDLVTPTNLIGVVYASLVHEEK